MEGLPFHVEFNGTESDGLWMSSGMISVTSSTSSCIYPSNLMGWIAGYNVFRFGVGMNIGFVPRSTAFTSYILNDGTPETFTGTLGIPDTKLLTSHGKTVSNSVFSWCLTPNDSDADNFFKDRSPYQAEIDGDLAIVADGSQTSGEYRFPVSFYAATFTRKGRQIREILPLGTVVRVSMLECRVSTPTEVNFGDVQYSGRSGAELARLTYPLIVSCSQTRNFINTNINVQWRAISGIDGAPGRLALRQGGGYITGSIDGVTPAGTCDSLGGILFDNTPLKIGQIGNNQNSQTINKQVTWRLCSGGASLPDGPVDAAAELLVTFN